MTTDVGRVTLRLAPKLLDFILETLNRGGAVPDWQGMYHTFSCEVDEGGTGTLLLSSQDGNWSFPIDYPVIPEVQPKVTA